MNSRFGYSRERIWFLKEGGLGREPFLACLGYQNLVPDISFVFVRGDRMLGVEFSLPADVWPEASAPAQYRGRTAGMQPGLRSGLLGGG